MAKPPVQLQGDDLVRANIQKLAKQYPQAMAAALYKLGIAILANSLPRVPREFGVLRASGYVSPPAGEGAKANVEVGYGTKYALKQHEDQSLKHPRGGEAKYLEKAVHALSSQSLQLLYKWIMAMTTSAGVVTSGGKWGAAGGVPSRPVVGNTNQKSSSQGARLKRAASNVRKKTGR